MERLKDFKKEKILPMILMVLILAVPVLSFAQGGIIPCEDDCDFQDFMQLINNVIKWIITISIPVAAGVFAWAGFQMMINASNPGKRAASIEMMKKVGIGFVFILAAWVIVNTITNTLLEPEFRAAVPVEGTKK